ncbi:MAG: OmpH family outer membrane protein [Spirochaetota bacterium]
MTHPRRIRRQPALLLGVFLILSAGTAAAEQLTTVAVFDLQQVLLSFYQDSSAVREYRRAEREYREDLLRAEDTLSDYQRRRADAIDRGNSRTAQRLREDIQSLQEDILALQERWFTRQEELQNELAGEEFYNQLYETAEFVAQDNGYTMVVDADALGLALFWYSSEIDITDAIIEELLARFR